LATVFVTIRCFPKKLFLCQSRSLF